MGLLPPTSTEFAPPSPPSNGNQFHPLVNPPPTNVRTRSNPEFAQTSTGELHQTAPGQQAACGPWRDRALVERCLAGNAEAWTELYERCHSPLLTSIKAILAPQRPDQDLVEEIAARVWYAVVVNDGRLLDRFDPNQDCRLITFLASIARSQTINLFRSEGRRRRRETYASRAEGQEGDSESQTLNRLDHFSEILTCAERAFFEDVLLKSASDAVNDYSATNDWQLRSRIRKKLAGFLDKREA